MCLSNELGKLEFDGLDKRETEPRGGTQGSLCEGAGREAD